MGRIDCFSPMVITPINFFSHDLWQWLAAAFPDAKYCLASATLTDAAVRDMQGVLVSLVLQFMLFHLTNSSFTAHQARGDEDSLQRSPRGPTSTCRFNCGNSLNCNLHFFTSASSLRRARGRQLRWHLLFSPPHHC